jgi:ribosome-binding factor A
MKIRLARVCEVIKRELGVLISRDFEFKEALVTINSVDITPDLKQAHVFISALGTPRGQREAIEALNAHRVIFQNELARRIKIKHTPHLHFRIDEAMERGSRVMDIMGELGLLEIPANDNADEKPEI